MTDDRPPRRADPSRRLYDADEVDAYIQSVHERVEELEAQVVALESKLETSSVDPLVFATAERLLGRALLSARRAAKDVETRAHRDASTVLTDARQQAEAILTNARQEAAALMGKTRRANTDQAAAPHDTALFPNGEPREELTAAFSRPIGGDLDVQSPPLQVPASSATPHAAARSNRQQWRDNHFPSSSFTDPGKWLPRLQVPGPAADR